MSGGRAFVLDLDARLVNPEMVDVLSLPADQEERVQQLLSRFYAETGSEVAKHILDGWAAEKARISLVMPRDYARVLSVIAAAERDGRPADEAIMEAING